MERITVRDALKQVLLELQQMTPDQLRAELENHRDGPLATALREADAFIKQHASSAGQMALD